MSEKEKQDFLRSRGWYTWYHPNYWVHEKLVRKPQAQDCTNYGMALDDAVRFENGEINNGKPFNGAFLGMRW